MPKVSVVIPTYNRQALVQQTIDSVLQQSFADLELIVVDDGSTDGSPQILPSLYGARIRYVYQDNQGESAARNYGLTLATGEYVAFLDSDDLWHPKKIERQLEVFAANPDVGLVSTQALWINSHGCQLAKPPHGTERHAEGITWEELVLDNVVAGGGSAAMVRRSCLEQTGGFDPNIRFGEEWDLWLRIARDFHIWQIPKPLVYYRLHRLGTRGWAPRPDEASQLFDEHRKILRKAFTRPLPPASNDALEGEAFCRIDVRQAIVDSVLENVSASRALWSSALHLCHEYATDPEIVRQHLINFTAGYASLAGSGKEIEEVGRILGRILDGLPHELNAITSNRRAMHARCLAELAFAAALEQNPRLARNAAVRCITRDPTWLRNLGLQKLIVNGGRHLWPRRLTLNES